MKGLKLWSVVIGALLLRVLRAVLRWDEICLAYAAYQQPWPEQGVLTFFGLHPPGYSAVFHLLPDSPMAWLLFSAVCSSGAVYLVGRIGGWTAAAFLAVEPLQIHYAAEVNNYPLLVLLVAFALHEYHHKRAWGLALAGVLAGWTHLLGGFAVGLLALSWFRTPREVGKVLGVMAVGCLPVVVVAAGLSTGDGTYGQGGLTFPSIANGLWVKVGWGLLLWPLAVAFSPRRTWLALALTAAILLVMGLGIAASHQQPYWLVLGPPLALGFSTDGHPAKAWCSRFVGLLGLALVMPEQGQQGQELRTNLLRDRAIDHVSADVLWLLKPALKVDDDKTAWSDVLWRFDPFQSMPVWEDGFEYVDYRYGQPRVIDGRIVHSSTALAPDVVPEVIRGHLAKGRSVQFVLYDHGPANDYPGMMRSVLAGFELDCRPIGGDVGLGVDELCDVR